MATTKKRTYADEARAIMNKYKLRLGDKFDKGDALSLESMNAELAALREKQEEERMVQLGGQMYACGGKLKGCGGKLKMATGGELPMFQGPGEYSNYLPSYKATYPYSQYFGEVMLDNAKSPFNMRTPNRFDLISGRSPLDPLQRPTMLPGATITASRPTEGYYNAGTMPETTIYGTNPNAGSPLRQFGKDFLTGKRLNPGPFKPSGNFANTPSSTLDFSAFNAKKSAGANTPATAPTPAGPITGNPISAVKFNAGTMGANASAINRGAYDALPNTPAEAMAALQGQSNPEGNDPYTSRVPWLGAAAGIVGGLLMNRKIDLPRYNYQEYDPTQIAPHLVDYSRGREQTMRERDIANARIRQGARGTGSQGALMENIIAGNTGTQRVAGTAFNQSLEAEQNQNAQILNEVAARNAQSRLGAAEMNARNKLYASQIDRENSLINEQQRQNRIGSVVDNITGYSKDLLAARQYDQMLNLMAPDNYKPTFGDQDSWFKRFFQLPRKFDIRSLNTNDKA